MNTEMILLKAQFEALRDCFTGLLSTVYCGDEQKIWYTKFNLWQFERESLAPFDYTDKISPHGKDMISRRRFQLQVLMDVAYIHGGLEEYGITRIIDSYAASQALQLFQQSGGTEEGMLPLIDKMFPGK